MKDIITLGSDILDVRATTIVRLNEHFSLTTTEKTYDLKVEILADFAEIPTEYHEVFLNILTSKYLNKVSFGHNSFSKCNPPKVIKWYQFWKWKVFTTNYENHFD
jgi:hypothetical protein